MEDEMWKWKFFFIIKVKKLISILNHLIFSNGSYIFVTSWSSYRADAPYWILMTIIKLN